MAEYTITDIENSHLVVEFSNGSWAKVPVKPGMTEEDIDDAVADFAPKPELDDEQIEALVGSTRKAKKKPKVYVESIDGSYDNSFAKTDAVETDKDEDSWGEPDLEEGRRKFIEEVKQEVLNEINGEV